MGFDLNAQAEMLATKARHYIITTMGRFIEDATNHEIYRAITYALREEVMINWMATERTRLRHDCRILYFLSLEYLPGRLFTNNLTNLQVNDVVKLALQKLNRNFNDIVDCEPDPGLGNGGLGRLASCFLDSLATLNYPAQAYGLRYQYGIFEQQIWDGKQIEAPDCWLMNENAWEFREDQEKLFIEYGGYIERDSNIHGDEIYKLKDYEEVWSIPFDLPIIGYSVRNKFSVCPLRIWSTKESPRNFHLQRYNAGSVGGAAENTTLTDVLYPSDHHDVGKRIRLKQEYLLVSASLQDIIRQYLKNHDNFRLFSDKVRIQINDTHPSLVVPELIRLLNAKYDIPWKKAVDICQECLGYTNHTIMSEALEQWDMDLIQQLLPRQAKVIERLNYEFLERMRNEFHADETRIRRMSIIEDGRVRMANLAIIGSHKVNGVAKLHTEILKNEVFHEFFETFPNKFTNVTNGVTQRRWLLHCNPELAQFITERIGPEWITNFELIRELEKFASDSKSQTEFLKIKRKNKFKLIEYLTHHNKIRDGEGNPIFPSPVIDVDSLFDVQIKRMHEYKRQLLNILHVIAIYLEMRDKPEGNRVKRTSIFAGKAAAGYEIAKKIIRLIECVARKVNKDPLVKGKLKVVFIENYNVSKARLIIPAADLSEQISTAGLEASGTGNMKLGINGALTIGTDDGANIEMREEVTDQWWPFVFGASAGEISALRKSGMYNPRDIYENTPIIKRVLDAINEGVFAENDEERAAFRDLFRLLLERGYSCPADPYFVLLDFMSYYQTQWKVEKLFQDPDLWAEYAIHNIAGMGKFSTDISIKNYSENIWGIAPCPSDFDILDEVRNEYNRYDQCRIY